MATAEATTTSMAQPALPLGLLALPVGAALPEPRRRAIGVVADGKLFVISYNTSREDLLVYDPQSETWTEAAPPPAVTNSLYISRACAHKGRLVVFLSNGRAFERANDGSWYPCEVAAGGLTYANFQAAPVILG